MLKKISRMILNLKQFPIEWKMVAIGILLGILSFLAFVIVLGDLTN
jgi:hypothetical protein